MTGTGPDTDTFRRRRGRVLETLGQGAAMILPAAPEIVVGRDTEIRYTVDPDLWYLTGYTEPEAVAVLIPGHEAPFTLFVRPRDPQRETWTGPRGGVEAATDRHHADAAHPIAELDQRLPKMLADVDRLHFRIGTGRQAVERLVLDVLARGRAGRQRTGRGPAALLDPGLILDEMRIIKEPSEIDAIREAVRITLAAFDEGLAAVRPGAGEWEIEAAVEAAFRRAGADGPAFATIAASGPNATVLHHIANDRVMQAGELLLLDAGARYRHYNADITRTVPVDGTFSAAQRDIHDLVLEAGRAATDAVRPGNTTADIHDAATRILASGLVDLGLLHGDPEQLTGTDDLKRYCPHNTSHWLGLDVHDVGTYHTDGQPRRLQPGMVLTIEPGLYIPQHDETASPHLRGIGVRIEDDVLVTSGTALRFATG